MFKEPCRGLLQQSSNRIVNIVLTGNKSRHRKQVAWKKSQKVFCYWNYLLDKCEVLSYTGKFNKGRKSNWPTLAGEWLWPHISARTATSTN